MSTLVIVGAQWGDEGKGKIVDLLAESADLVIRYGGGANAGHTLVVGGEKVVFHLVPSGALHDRPRCALGAGVVIDPRVLADEIDELERRGKLREGRLLISERAHLVMPYHVAVDGAREQGARPIGTTKRGIGPTYQDRAARRGIRMGHLRDRAGFAERVAFALEAWRPELETRGVDVPSVDELVDGTFESAERLLPFIGDAVSAASDAYAAKERILLEGAQGTMLDIDHGTYPYVTSSSVTAAGAATGSGLGPTCIDRVIGVTKAYTTRVGEGPFPTEMADDDADALRQAGAEFGATTGRPRRCGWLDLPVLRHAARVNGLSELAITKLDVLAGIDPIRVCVAYEIDGVRHEVPPAFGLERAEPIYEDLAGFDGELASARRMDDLPANARALVERIESWIDIPATIVSVGPDREETIVVKPAWS